MESHPVPQNVTAFEFHLIGNMTVRQFAYLAVGMVIAYLSFILFVPIFPLLGWPITVTGALLGAAYAFLPIMERPLDYWTAAFFKAIFKPTIRNYKIPAPLKDDAAFADRLKIYLHSMNNPTPDMLGLIPTPIKIPVPQSVIADTTPPPAPEVLETAPVAVIPPQQPAPVSVPITPVAAAPTPTPQPPVQRTVPIYTPPPMPTPANPAPQPIPEIAIPTTLPSQTPAPTANPVSSILNSLSELGEQLSQTAMPSFGSTPQSSDLPSTPSNKDLDKTVALAKDAQVIQNEILATEKRMEEIKRAASVPGSNPNEYTKEFEEVLANLQKLNQQEREISKQLAQINKAAIPANSTPPVKPNIIPSLTLTTVPNILNGIITDSQGNYLEGAIIVTHDKAGIPVRALKSNKLGQFIAATPLESGVYTIQVEKDTMTFDTAEIELTGQVINPIVISAKKGGV